MRKIKKVYAREILDSRGDPTVEAEVTLDNGIMGRFAVPSGASTGEHEALELRDGDKKRFNGKGVLKAVRNVNTIIAKKIKGKEADFRKIDKMLITLDGTENKSRLGANAILGVSIATAKAAALSYRIPLYKYLNKNARLLPVPHMNVLNGGMHADNNLDIQEFMIVPFGFRSFRRALQAASEVFHTLKGILKSKKLSTSVGDEGGFAPYLKKNEEAVELIVKAIRKAGYSTTKDICIALDPAANSFFRKSKYSLDGRLVSSDYMVSFYGRLIKKYPIFSIEDGLAEDDWPGWVKLTKHLGNKIQLVGDDIFVTNTKRIKKGIAEGVANSVLIKVNQIGTLTEALGAVGLAFNNGYTAVISHRSGETEDTTIAHLAVASGCGQIKTGSISRSERIAKYNELLRIEEGLGKKSAYASSVVTKRFI